MNAQDYLDEFKLRIAIAVLASNDISAIRGKGLSNINRWVENGVWCIAFDEWRALLESGTDEQIVFAMTDKGQHANRLRQSAPYKGLLNPLVREQILNEVLELKRQDQGERN